MLAFIRFLFYLLYNHRISKLIRPFSFWGYLGVIMIDGNLQMMYFLMFSQNSLLFSFDFNDKIQHVLEQFIFCIYLLFSVSCYFLYYSFYKKLSKYFLDNCKLNISSVFGLAISSCFRQLCLAAIHNLLRHDPPTQNLMLIGVEVLYICFTIFYSEMTKKFQELLVVWVSLIFSFLRIVINGILYY